MFQCRFLSPVFEHLILVMNTPWSSPWHALLLIWMHEYGRVIGPVACTVTALLDHTWHVHRCSVLYEQALFLHHSSPHMGIQYIHMHRQILESILGIKLKQQKQLCWNAEDSIFLRMRRALQAANDQWWMESNNSAECTSGACFNCKISAKTKTKTAEFDRRFLKILHQSLNFWA